MGNDLQSKLGDGLSKLSGSIEQGKQKLQVAQEINRLNKNIHELSQKKTKILLDLGLLTYQKIREGVITDEDLVQLSTSIIGFDKNTFEALKVITELNKTDVNQKICSSCGTANGLNDKFCGGCGTRLEDHKSSSSIDSTSCKYCEEIIDASANFCPCCGKKTEKLN